MKQTATVIHTDGNIATVRVSRPSSCSSCESSAACGVLCAKPLDVSAHNDARASAGDLVEVESSSRAVLGYSALAFAAPVVGGLAAYFTAFSLGAGETAAYVFAAAAVAAALASLFLTVKLRSAKDLKVSVVKILNSADNTADVTGGRAAEGAENGRS